MDRTAPHAERGRHRTVPGAMVALFALVLLSGPAFAACSASHDGTTAAGTAAMPTMTDGPASPMHRWRDGRHGRPAAGRRR